MKRVPIRIIGPHISNKKQERLKYALYDKLFYYLDDAKKTECMQKLHLKLGIVES